MKMYVFVTDKYLPCVLHETKEAAIQEAEWAELTEYKILEVEVEI